MRAGQRCLGSYGGGQGKARGGTYSDHVQNAEEAVDTVPWQNLFDHHLGAILRLDTEPQVSGQGLSVQGKEASQHPGQVAHDSSSLSC